MRAITCINFTTDKTHKIKNELQNLLQIALVRCNMCSLDLPENKVKEHVEADVHKVNKEKSLALFKDKIYLNDKSVTPFWLDAVSLEEEMMKKSTLQSKSKDAISQQEQSRRMNAKKKQRSNESRRISHTDIDLFPIFYQQSNYRVSQ